MGQQDDRNAKMDGPKADSETELGPIGTITREIARAIVDRPEEARVSEISGTQATVLEVRVAPGDQGKLIGRQGRIANAIRELLVNFGGRTHRRYILEIIE